MLAAEGGRVTFARFMELALTHPVDGYYSRAGRILGPRADFSTAPRLSPDFNGALGRLVGELVDAALAPGREPGGRPADGPGLGPEPGLGGLMSGGSRALLVELGGGEGDLAKALLEGWSKARSDLRGRLSYVIVEVGEPLWRRQRRALAAVMAAGWEVRWAASPGEALAVPGRAVVVGNEFVDALPVHVVDVRGPAALEAWVELGKDAEGEGGAQVKEVWDRLSPEAEAELGELFGTADPERLRPLTRDGMLEVRPAVAGILAETGAREREVCLLTVDYGEWYRSPVERGGRARAVLRGRTVRGYFRHQLSTDPYVRVGRQDLTADVDFGALDRHGRRAGFETMLFTTVAALLLSDGADSRLKALNGIAAGGSTRSLEAGRQAAVLEQLVDERRLGGAFKVMLQVREAR